MTDSIAPSSADAQVAARKVDCAWTPFCLLMLVWLAINFLTLDRYPCAWIDEVSYADPAVNLLLHGKWASTAWYAQSEHEFWAGNVPLYSALLFPWLKAFGFSMRVVRSFDIVLFGLVAVVWFRIVSRLTAGSSKARGTALLFVLLLLGEYGTILIYRGARPDAVCMLPMFIAALSWIENWRSRYWIAFTAALLLPWAGLQVLPMLTVVGLFLLLTNLRANLALVTCLAAGSVLGLALLLEFYYWNGVLDSFARSIAPHISPVAFKHEIFGSRSPKDLSLFALLAGVVALEVAAIKDRRFSIRSPISLSVFLAIGIGITLFAAGKFPSYYGWMIYIPLLIGVIPEWARPDLSQTSAMIFRLTFLTTTIIGPALHCWSAVYDWPYRDPMLPEQIVSRNIVAGDVVYGNPCAYYALVRQGITPYIGLYLDGMSEEEKQRTTVLLINPKNCDLIITQFGGAWRKVDEYKPARGGLPFHLNFGWLTSFDYAIEVYRRSEAGIQPQAISQSTPRQFAETESVR